MKTREIAEVVGGELVGDGEVEVSRVAALGHAGAGEIAFADRSDTELGEASCVLVGRGFDGTANGTIIKVEDPKLAFSLVARILHPSHRPEPFIHQTALVRDSVSLGEGVIVEPYVCVDENSVVGSGTYLHAAAIVGQNVRIGVNCEIHPHVVIRDNCSIGNNVILHAGVVIGAPGFGYVKAPSASSVSTTPSAEAAATPPNQGGEPGGGEYVLFPQIGTVVIEDNVEIGANSCIDRGALGETRIGAGTKIDNLVQIAHNVTVGKRVVIAAQTGISGSTVIEDDCVIGGQVGMGDHATVKSGAIIGSQAGVLPGKIVRAGVWWGTPIQPLDEYKRQNAMVKGLSRLKDEVRELKKKLGA